MPSVPLCPHLKDGNDAERPPRSSLLFGESCCVCCSQTLVLQFQPDNRREGHMIKMEVKMNRPGEWMTE